MQAIEPGTITRLLYEARDGDSEARQLVARRVYDELRHSAQAMLGVRKQGVLQTTAVLNEAFAKLLRAGTLYDAPSRKYLFGAATQAIREVLIDYSRQEQAQKRKAHREALDPEVLVDARQLQTCALADVHDAIRNLQAVDPRKSDVVVLRFFAGMSLTEIAGLFDVSLSTVERDWRFARAWLHRTLRSDSTT